jgi:hypothetical protein
MTMTNCCANCGKEGGVSLKACKSCMQVKYCNAKCQKKHWSMHKKQCKIRAAELRDKALFTDPPAKEDCPICFLPMPVQLICCVSLPPATILSVPIYDFAIAHEGLKIEPTETNYPCYGKSICGGCVHSFYMSGNASKCPFCNSDRGNKTDEDGAEDNTKRAAVNDPASICLLAAHYHHGRAGFHFEAAAMAGDEVARCNLGVFEAQSGNIEQAIKHWTIAASVGSFNAMQRLKICFGNGHASKESMDSTLTAYNSSCAEMRSEARDACIRAITERN